MKPSLSTILLITILLLCLAVDVQAKKKMSKFEKYQKKRRDDCSQIDCRHIPKDLNDNCVNQCFSRTCFEKVYIDNPLEDGEYDIRRQRLFNDCTRDEFANCVKNPETCPPDAIAFL